MHKVCFCFMLSLIWAVTIFTSTESAVTESGAVKYLREYGYTPPSNPMLGNLMTKEELTESIRTFQRIAGLAINGKLDKPTLEKMSQKRCGNSDIVGTETTKRKKRYALQGSKWRKNDLTYKITEYTSDLSRSEVDKQIKEAFKWWADVSGLTFTQVSSTSKADIVILFGAREHGDGDPFDGPGRTLAHAYFPVYGGDAHFDEAETWTIHRSRSGAKLEIVAAHEFGHSLGLSHSDVHDALMAPFYNPDVRELHRDDIMAIQRLYGKHEEKPPVYPTNPTTTRRTTTTTTTRPTTTTLRPPVGACNGRFDAITTMNNGSIYAFVGEEFWRLNDRGADEGYPQSIKGVWGIKGSVDAALTYSSYTDVFQGNKVYRYYNGKLASSYPRLVSELYRGVPSNIDTAFQWSGNDKIYFMKGNEYWRYNTYTRQVDNNYPRSLDVWKGLPDKIDAAMQWQDQTFFFSDGMYYRFDDEKINVAELRDLPYPRRTDKWWLGCQDNTLRQAIVDNRGNGASSSKTGNKSFHVFLSVIAMTVLKFSLL